MVWSPFSPRDSQDLLQLHSSKASILQYSAFFIVQISHPYMTTGKTISLTRWTFVGKVMSLLFNMLSRLVIAFLPRSKCLLISWCSHHLQWFWSPQKANSIFPLFPLFPHLFAMKWWGLPGTSPGWSRVFEVGTASATYLFKYFIKDIKSNRMRIAQ